MTLHVDTVPLETPAAFASEYQSAIDTCPFEGEFHSINDPWLRMA